MQCVHEKKMKRRHNILKPEPIDAILVPHWKAEQMGEDTAVFWCTNHSKPVSRRTAYRHISNTERQCCFFKETSEGLMWKPFTLVLDTKLRRSKKKDELAMTSELSDGTGISEILTRKTYETATIQAGEKGKEEERNRDVELVQSQEDIGEEMIVTQKFDDDDAGNIDDEVNDPPFNMVPPVTLDSEDATLVSTEGITAVTDAIHEPNFESPFLKKGWTIPPEHYKHPAAMELACLIIENNLTQYTVDRQIWVMQQDSTHIYGRKYINSLCDGLRTVKQYHPGHNSIYSFFQHVLSCPMLVSRCIWSSNESQPAMPVNLYSDLTDGKKFKEYCKQHPKYDAEGRIVYTGVLCLYIDSGEASAGSMAGSNTIIHAYCGNLNRHLRNMEEFSCPLSIYRGPHRDVYKYLRVILDELDSHQATGVVMLDSARQVEVRLYVHLLLISADSQMRWIIGSVNPPSQSERAFSHETDPRSLELCLMCHERRPNFGLAQAGRARSYEESVDVTVRLQLENPNQRERERT